MTTLNLISVLCAVASITLNLAIVVDRKRKLRAPKALRLVPFDANGPIVGKPTRQQWRLRRRALLEAAEICDAWARATQYEMPRGGYDAEVCARHIRNRVDQYDRSSPEFSESSETRQSAETAA